MTNFEPTLELSVDNLRERRSQLQSELNKTVTELVTTGLKASVKELFALAGVTNAQRISWDFYPESDDEGGSNWYVTDIYVSFDGEGEDIDLEEVTIQRESWRKDGTFYEYSVYDELRDIMSDFSSDLYDQDITDIEL
jgi:hypothetical protein